MLKMIWGEKKLKNQWLSERCSGCWWNIRFLLQALSHFATESVQHNESYQHHIVFFHSYVTGNEEQLTGFCQDSRWITSQAPCRQLFLRLSCSQAARWQNTHSWPDDVFLNQKNVPHFQNIYFSSWTPVKQRHTNLKLRHSVRSPQNSSRLLSALFTALIHYDAFKTSVTWILQNRQPLNFEIRSLWVFARFFFYLW